QQALDWFMRHQRPSGWRQWPEVVWRDERAPKFIGDLPHTWVGSDFVRSVIDMIAYERESDDALVVGAGVPAKWLSQAPGLSVRGLRTRYGPLDLRMLATNGTLEARIDGIKPPRGGIVIAAPGVTSKWTATVNGRRSTISTAGELHLTAVPATVRLIRPAASRP
ncbi:MAG TPA: hypothetical protein VFP10_04585, partial [Candidatus Eisenbacteria bacterium]|nr:hypothetical protein [Candidatus Eisenbacteria bacterium]